MVCSDAGVSRAESFQQKMSNKEELVFVNCIHEGCKSKRMFMKPTKGELPEYVCTKHRRLYPLHAPCDPLDIAKFHRSRMWW